MKMRPLNLLLQNQEMQYPPFITLQPTRRNVVAVDPRHVRQDHIQHNKGAVNGIQDTAPQGHTNITLEITTDI